MGQIYFVQSGDSLWKIAKRFGVTVQDLLDTNAICHKDWIYIGQLLVIPDPNLNLPKAGGIPYYIVEPGDSLWCIHNQFNIPIYVLAANNHVTNPNLIYPEQELTLVNPIPNLLDLKAKWDETGKPDCIIYGLQVHGLYIDTFAWEAIGPKAIPYLLELLNHPCLEIRFYVIVSLGRIGYYDRQVLQALQALLNDPEEVIRDVAQATLYRIQRIEQTGNKRLHVLIWDDILLQTANMGSQRVHLQKGTEILVLRWFIPSPTGEEGPVGDLQYYDYVQVVATGDTGFLPRWARGELNLI